MAAESNNPPQPPSQAGTDTAPRKPDPICAVIARTRHDMIHAEVMEAARRNVMLAELRLDYLAKAADFGRLLAEKPLPLLATVRRREDGGRFKGTEQERRMLLRQAIVAGFDWVDIEEDIIQSVPRYGKTKRIVSYHNFKEVPADLHGLFRRMHEADADIIKIACMPQQIEDVARVLDLLRFTKKPTIALCMGDMGLPSRVIQGALGAPFTYAAINPERLPAPGMLTVGQLQNIYGVRRLNKETKIFGVVGDPIGHSLSPIVHNIGFRKLGINALYLPFKVPEGKLSNFLASHSALKIQGLSVTIPHKESAVHQATELESLVAQTQSANTLVRTASGFKALNTDRPAILDSLVAGLPANPDGTPGTLNQKLALVLGAGGPIAGPPARMAPEADRPSKVSVVVGSFFLECHIRGRVSIENVEPEDNGLAAVFEPSHPAAPRPEPPDPFDPASLRLGADFGAGIGVKRVISTVPVRKPGKQEWFRVRPGEGWRIETCIFEAEADRETYLVDRSLWSELAGEIHPALVLVCVNRATDVFLWRCKLPGPDGRPNVWNESAMRIALAAESRWVRMASNMAAGHYEHFEPATKLPDPEWPPLTFTEILRVAFRDRMIDSLEHPVVRQLRGQS